MNLRSLLALGFALAIVPATPAAIIDLFGDDSDVTDGTAAGATPDGGIAIGGSVFTTRELTATTNGVGDTSIEADLGILALSTQFDTTGTAMAIYTGNVVDFSAANMFMLDFLGADFTGADVFIELTDSSNATASADFTGAGTLGTAGTTLSVSAGAFGGINMAAIQQVKLTFNGVPAANDLAFDNLRTSDVPEPGAITLFGAGLLGLAYLRRKRK